MRYFNGFRGISTGLGMLITLCVFNAFESIANPTAAVPHAVQTFWVDDAGNDASLCSEIQPCRTINRALDLAGNGDVIQILPGVYREQLEISHSGITLEGVAAGVFILGAEKPVLLASENKYVADWGWGDSFKGTTFCNNLTNDVSVSDDACNTLGFWQDGVRLDQVFAKANVVAGTFYYDFGNEQVWLLPVAGNNNLTNIEGLAWPYTLKLTAQSSNVTLKNLNIWYGASMPDDGILIIEGAGHSIIDVDVRYSAGAGIKVFGADQVTMDNVQTSGHGQNGMRVSADASFSTSTGWTINDRVDNLQLLQSFSHDNGWKGYDNCWGGGGTKFSFTNNLSIQGFYSADNNGFGVWLDIENHNYTIEESLSARDAGRGIFVEYISDNGVVENNVVFGTRDADAIGCGISVGLAAADSRNVLIKNNTVYSTAPDVKGLMLKTGCTSCRSFPYPSEDISWENNLLVNKEDAGFVRDLDAGTNTTFTYQNTYVEEEFAGDATVFVCWDAMGNCSKAALGIETLSSGVYLENAGDECGFKVTNNLLTGIGAQAFVHPRAVEICGDTPSLLPPVAGFAFDVNFLEVTFTDTSTDDGQIVDWSWDFGDGAQSTVQHPQHVYSASGSFIVLLTVTDDKNLTDTIEKTVTVEEMPVALPPVAAFSFLADALNVSFTDKSTDEDGSIVSWLWDFGDGEISQIQNPVHSYAEAGSFTVSLTVTDDAGLAHNTSMQVEVQDIETGTGAFIEEAGRVVMEAEHYVERFSNVLTQDAWLLQETAFDNEPVSAMQALEDNGHMIGSGYTVANAEMKFPVLLNSTGVFYIWLRMWPIENGSSAYVGCEEESMRMGVSNRELMDAGWIWLGLKNGGRRAQFTAADPGEKICSIWMREDGLYIDRIVLTTDVNYVPEGTGPDESPRVEIANKTLTAAKKDVDINTLMSALPDAFNITSHYPNPTTNTLVLSMDMPEAGYLEGVVYNMLGQEVQRITRQPLAAGKKQEIALDVSKLSTGTYLYQLMLDDNPGQKLFYGKFVVVKG